MPRDLTQRTCILHIVPQRGTNTDCAIASLASYTGVTYEAAMLAIGRVTKRDPLTAGVHTSELKRAARLFGVRLRVIPWDRVHDDTATGIIHVHGRFFGERYEDHLAIYHDGQIIDLRDPSLWDADMYLKHYAGTAVSLTVEA